MDEEVDCISGHIALGPATVTFFYDETGISGQLEITRFFGDKMQVAFLKQGNQGGRPDRSDLFPCPRPGRTYFFGIESGDEVVMFLR